ncbi:MAG: carbon-nitrogen hydrolase family protein [Endomicrobia bacterium]|nr:carbon-nitrogen hydrolase family protein [Endomicrobiia bacterium]
MKKFIICGVQPKIIPLAIEENVNYCIIILKDIFKKIKPNLLVFPETITTGFSLTKESIPKVYNELRHKLPTIFAKIGQLAKKYNTNIVFTTYEPAYIKNKFYNSAILFSSKGQIESIYRKTFLFPTEFWSIPGRKPFVWKTEFAKIGCMICFDGDFPELARQYALKGAEVIIRPSALLRDFKIWSVTNISRAYENQVYLCAVNNIGMDSCGKTYYGHSMLVDPYARVLAQLGSNEDFFVKEVVPLSQVDTSNIVKINHIDHFVKNKDRL